MAALVPMFTILTGAFGTAALLASVTTPVMLPRSDCAKHSVAAEKQIKNDSLIVMQSPSTRRVPAYMSAIVLLQIRGVKEKACTSGREWPPPDQRYH